MEELKKLNKNDFIDDKIQIIIRNAKKPFKIGDNQIKALDNINLVIKKGDFKLIQGPSGCGKTTLLNILGGLDTLDSGEVLINFGIL
ncbi:MAG: ATP-binding cassette domain-containing protein [Candidatus Lokiarchaeota archaeon]|nr:ATP-binding cassette domain-containing protein [Candidatus Lokiarchaeota archaeon]